MKAFLYQTYGPPDVLQLKEVPKPVPTADQVLVKVYAASVNPADWHTMRGAPFLARLANGLFKPKDPRLGADVAGRIEALGANVADFKVGDDIFGLLSLQARGSFAEYVCIEPARIASIPPNLTYEQAAAVPIAAYTALQGLSGKGHLRAGQSVLVNGASGGVGTFAVQIARAEGATVTGVCSTRNLELVRSIGADHVIDYTQQDFTQTGERYDLIFDAVGNRTISDLRRALNPNGICVVAGFTNLSLLLQHALLGGKQVGLMPTAHSDKQDLLTLQQMLASGKIVPVIDRTYPLSQTPDAIRYVETNRARGKVVIAVAQNGIA